MAESFYRHRDNKWFTRTFPEGFEAAPVSAAQINQRSNRSWGAGMNRTHWQIKTPFGVIQWWPSRGRWQLPGMKKSDCGNERDFIAAMTALTKGGGVMEEDHEEEEGFDCGMAPDGSCQLAGTEDCEFECPYRDIDPNGGSDA